MKNLFWKRLLHIYIEEQNNLEAELIKLKDEIQKADIDEGEKERRIAVLNKILESDRKTEVLLNSTAEEVARALGDLCQI
ncbi:MAG TPA: hypothetical protein EYP30_03685 [Archaeoglobaceae archaeon]|nr:hypothetical protein [Archaeoglobaceae archaeon]